MESKRKINLMVLPGEPLDGSGRTCIHLFVQDEAGGSVEKHALHPVFKDGVQVKQQVTAGPARGGLACNIKRSISPVAVGGVTTITQRTDDPRAVTCLKCKASKVYAEMMEKITRLTAAQ